MPTRSLTGTLLIAFITLMVKAHRYCLFETLFYHNARYVIQDSAGGIELSNA